MLIHVRRKSDSSVAIEAFHLELTPNALEIVLDDNSSFVRGFQSLSERGFKPLEISQLGKPLAPG